MKKLLIVLCLALMLTFSATAHSGGTDGQGGHHSGSGYHYHHGYSAHDHCDMDGDGTIDCPYNFKDNTKPNTNSSAGSVKSDKITAAVHTPKQTQDVNKDKPIQSLIDRFLNMKFGGTIGLIIRYAIVIAVGIAINVAIMMIVGYFLMYLVKAINFLISKLRRRQ